MRHTLYPHARRCVLWISIPLGGGRNLLVMSGHLPMKKSEKSPDWKLGYSEWGTPWL